MKKFYAKMLRESVHLFAALQFSYAVFYDWNYVVVPASVSNIGLVFGGKLKFLTFWDAIIQSILFWLCFINDFCGSNEVSPRQKPFIRKVKDAFFCSIAFPLSAFVCLTFWGIYAIDRELIFPVEMDYYFPSWLNHVMHTNILVFTAVEFFTTFRAYPSRKDGLTILITFMAVYLIWVIFIFSRSGYWVYPIMEVLNWPLRILFFVVMLMFVVGIYILQENLNQKVWSKELSKIGGKKDNQKKSK